MATQNPKITISSLENTIEREMTSEELEILEKAQNDIKERNAAQEAERNANEAAKAAILVKLGLTETELKQLLS